MTLAQVLVTVLGGAAIAAELWYFLLPGDSASAAAKGGVQEVPVTVKGGYTPDTIVVRAGKPVRLRFYRDETADGSEEVVFETLGIRCKLPPFQTTMVEFTPEGPGEHPFGGKAPLRGLVVVEPSTGVRQRASPHKHHG